jgi:hypothetical protein
MKIRPDVLRVLGFATLIVSPVVLIAATAIQSVLAQESYLVIVIEIVSDAVAFLPPLAIGSLLVVRYIRSTDREGHWLDPLLGALNLLSLGWLFVLWILLGLLVAFYIDPLVPGG